MMLIIFQCSNRYSVVVCFFLDSRESLPAQHACKDYYISPRP